MGFLKFLYDALGNLVFLGILVGTSIILWRATRRITYANAHLPKSKSAELTFTLIATALTNGFLAVASWAWVHGYATMQDPVPHWALWLNVLVCTPLTITAIAMFLRIRKRVTATAHLRQT